MDITKATEPVTTTLPLAAGQSKQVEPTSGPAASPSASSWTWQVVLVVLGLVLASFVFAYALISIGVDPRLTTGITLLIVIGIVVCVVPSKSGNTFGRRLARALNAFFNGGNDQK